MSTVPERSEVAEQFKWDTASIYADDTLWEKAYMLVGMENMMVYFLSEPGFAREVLKPGGLSRSSISSIYRRVPVKAGAHTLKARLNDNGEDGFNYAHEETVNLAPGRVMLIDFKDGGFIFRTHSAT